MIREVSHVCKILIVNLVRGAIKRTKVQCPTSNNVQLTPNYFAVGVQFRSFSTEQVMLKSNKDTTMGITCSVFPNGIKGVDWGKFLSF